MKNFLKFWLLVAILAMLTNCGECNPQANLEHKLSSAVNKIKIKIHYDEIKTKSNVRIAYLELEDVMMQLDSLEQPRRKEIERDIDYVTKRLDILAEDFDYKEKIEKQDGVSTNIDTTSMIQKYFVSIAFIAA